MNKNSKAKDKMESWYVLLACGLILGLIFGFLFGGYVSTKDNDEIWDSYFYKGYNQGWGDGWNDRDNYQWKINKIYDEENCWEITCECAKNTSTPCMAFCWECEEDIK